MVTRKMGKFDARLGPTTLDTERRTVTAIATTGSKGSRGSFDESLNVKGADLTRLNSGTTPVLDSHNNAGIDSILGTVQRAWIEGDKILVQIRFAETQRGDQAMGMVERAELKNLSIGYRVERYERVQDDSSTRDHYRAEKFEILEVSFVPVPFDAGATVRSQNENEILNRAESAKENEMTPQEAALAERTRIRALKQVGRESGIDEKTIDTWIDTGLTEDEAKVRALKFQAMQYDNQRNTANQIDATTRVEVGTSNRAGKLEQAAEALAFRINSSLKPKENSEFVGRSMVQILERSIVDRKLGMSNEQVVARAMSSTDFPLLLANVAEKVAAARYQLQPKNWSKFAATDVLRNFKLNNVVRGGDFPSLSEVEEGGEIQNGSFGEKQEQVQLKSWGRIVGLTRRALVNDDLGQLALVANDAGTSAARLENKLVFDVLKNNSAMSDGYNLFSSEHANLGSGAAISDTSIGEAFKLMRQQKTDDGLDQLNLNPKFMIVGPESEALARKYLAQLNPASVSDVNVWAGSLELIVDSEINSNDYFFVADPQMARAIMLYRLEGYESPRIETRVDFRSESVEIKCAHDAAAAAIDHRPLVKNANAS